MEFFRFIKGRNNLATTIHVPYDCDNNCKFCSSKCQYKKYKADPDKVKKCVLETNKLDFKDYVITGGEPMSNIKFLKELVELLDRRKNVYINTSFINKDVPKFIELVNRDSKIRGVNISRHCTSYEEDVKMLNNILEDEYILLINKPVKINVVLSDDNSHPDKLNEIIERWSVINELKDKKNISVSFRRNYNTKDTNKLHYPDQHLIDLWGLSSEGLLGTTQCDVCYTANFNRGDLNYGYHKGYPLTSVDLGNNVCSINDIVISQDGHLSYDWDRRDDNISYMLMNLDYKELRYPTYRSSSTCGGRSVRSCGSSGC